MFHDNVVLKTPTLGNILGSKNVANPFDELKKAYEDQKNLKEGELTALVNYTNDVLVPKKQVFEELWKKKLPSKLYDAQYKMIKTLGAGSFGRVVLVTHYSDASTYYAMKVMDKEKVVKLKQLDHTRNEKRILQCIDFPNTSHLVESFKDANYIYLVLPFYGGGEMFTILRKMEKFKEEVAMFYAAQVVLAIEYLHFLDLMFRDLKPENIVFDCNGYLKLIDFGFCKMVKGRAWTVCGTPEYIAPEIILSRGYGKAGDWWSVGVLIFEMNAGYPPFYANDHMRLYEKIIAGKYKCASHFSQDLINLVKNLLQGDLTKRYGNLKSGADDIKQSPWFKTTNWLEIYFQSAPSPLKIDCKSPEQLTDFGKSPPDEPLKEGKAIMYEREFQDF